MYNYKTNMWPLLYMYIETTLPWQNVEIHVAIFVVSSSITYASWFVIQMEKSVPNHLLHSTYGEGGLLYMYNI